MTFSIPKDLVERMKKYPEIKWESIARSAVENYLEKLEIADKIAFKSKLTLKDVEEIGNEITRRSWERHKRSLKQLEK